MEEARLSLPPRLGNDDDAYDNMYLSLKVVAHRACKIVARKDSSKVGNRQQQWIVLTPGNASTYAPVISSSQHLPGSPSGHACAVSLTNSQGLIGCD